MIGFSAFYYLILLETSEASEQSERAKLSGAARVGVDMNFWMSGTFLCLLLLLLLWVLLLLLVLLPLVGNFGPLQLHASTTFKNVCASRSLLRQVSQVGSCGQFFSLFFRFFFYHGF